MRSSNGSRRDPERERQWRERVAAWEASGQTAKAFCLEEGLGLATFYSWRRKLRLRDGQKRPGAGRKRARFMAVDLVPGDGPAAIELILENQTRLRIQAGVDRRDLVAVLQAVRDASSC